MPTYDYRCDTCEHTFEIFQSFSEEPLSKCPQEICNGVVKKIFSAPGISFKGSGFYKNDNRSKSSSKSTSPDTASKSSDSKNSNSKDKSTSDSTSNSSIKSD
ncbi:MAG: FmdB family transcriptional regulator [Acidimicrobiaceae bacterium]|jgi:putative FmdB family regulatory protein|nr:FmdB family transcriptional regulator [Acidimicrobiaceae bacterium]